MFRQFIWALLVVIGCVLLFASVFPVFAFTHFGEPWQTTLVASKLIMLPAGAICLFLAAALKARKVRH